MNMDYKNPLNVIKKPSGNTLQLEFTEKYEEIDAHRSMEKTSDWEKWSCAEYQSLMRFIEALKNHSSAWLHYVGGGSLWFGNGELLNKSSTRDSAKKSNSVHK